MSRKKAKKKPETVQATLGEVLGENNPAYLVPIDELFFS